MSFCIILNLRNGTEVSSNHRSLSTALSVAASFLVLNREQDGASEQVVSGVVKEGDKTLYAVEGDHWVPLAPDLP